MCDLNIRNDASKTKSEEQSVVKPAIYIQELDEVQDSKSIGTPISDAFGPS